MRWPDPTPRATSRAPRPRRSPAALALRALRVAFERAQLVAPERLDLGEPGREVAERLGAQPVDAAARVPVVALLLHESTGPQHAEVSAHRGRAHAERVGELARAARLAAQ